MDIWATLRYVFCRMFCPCKHHHRRTPKVRMTLRYGAFAVTFEGDSMFTLPDDKTAAASVAYVDAKGNPAKVEGAPVWSSSDDTILSVLAAADGMSAVVTPVGPLGSAQVKIEADADLGAGVSPIITLADVEVVAGTAVSGNVTLTIQ
jgi:hypothetical protein